MMTGWEDNSAHQSLESIVKKINSQAAKVKARPRGRPSQAEKRTRGKDLTRVTPTTLGSRIRLARQQLGLSQQELAAPEYVASYVSLLERDRIRPSLKALEYFAEKLGEPLEYLLSGSKSQGALHPTANEPFTSVPDINFTLTAQDKMLEVQVLLENVAVLDRPVAQPLLEEAGEIINSLENADLAESEQAVLGFLVGRLALEKEEVEAAISALQKAQPQAARTGQFELENEICFWLGLAYFKCRQSDRALILHQGCKDKLEQNQDQWRPDLMLQILIALARDHLVLGNSEKALEVFDEALNYNMQFNQPQARAQFYHHRAGVCRQQGDLSNTCKYNKRALELYEELNTNRQILRLSFIMGELMGSSGKIAEAEKVLLEGLQHGLQLKSAGSDLALAYNSLASLRLQQGNLTEAERLSRIALKNARRGGDKLEEGKALSLTAEILAQQDNQVEARNLYEEAIEVLEKNNLTEALGEVYKTYGAALSRWGDLEKAVRFLKKAYDSKP